MNLKPNTVQTTISFEAAHRLFGVDTYSTECSTSIHGHSYKVTVVVGSYHLNEAHMVTDFKRLKEVVKTTIHDPFDHSLILREDDPLVQAIQAAAPEQKMNLSSCAPTAEWMSEEFANRLSKAFSEVDPDVEVVSVSVQETENNIATYRRSGV